MPFLRRSIPWVMLAAGLLTCTMFQATLAPAVVLHAFFGTALAGPAAEIVVRNWGALIGLGGLLLIYGAWREAARNVALVMAMASKLVFITLVLLLGSQFLSLQAGMAVAADAVMVLWFAAYLLAIHRAAPDVA